MIRFRLVRAIGVECAELVELNLPIMVVAGCRPETLSGDPGDVRRPGEVGWLVPDMRLRCFDRPGRYNPARLAPSDQVLRRETFDTPAHPHGRRRAV